MKRIMALLLVACMVVSLMMSTTAVYAEDEEFILFEDDFELGNLYWSNSGLSFKNGKVESTNGNFNRMGIVTAYNAKDKFIWDTFSLEFDVCWTEKVGAGGWFAIITGDRQIFFRSTGGAYYVPASGSEVYAGKCAFKANTTYRMKFDFMEKGIRCSAKEEGKSSFSEIFVIGRIFEEPKALELMFYGLKGSFDNLKMVSSEPKKMNIRNKVQDVEVGKTGKLDIQNAPEGITYKSSNESVVSIDADGNWKALKGGTAIINIFDKNGNKIDNACIKVTVPLVSLTIDYYPDKNAIIGKDSIKFDREKIVLGVGETTDIRVRYGPDNTNYKFVDWSVEDPTILEMYGTAQDARAFTATSVGETTVVAKSKVNDATAKINVKVIPAEEINKKPTENIEFNHNGRKHAIPPHFLGVSMDAQSMLQFSLGRKTDEHNGTNGPYDWDKVKFDMIGLKSLRSFSYLEKNGEFRAKNPEMYTDFIEYTDETISKPWLDYIYGICEKYNVPYIFCPGGFYGYLSEPTDEAMQGILNTIEYIKSIYDGPIYFELFNEVYAISWKKCYPTVKEYVARCKEIVDAVRKIAPDTIFIACGIEYGMYKDITYDEGNFVLTAEGDLAYTQGTRVVEWNPAVKELIDEGYCDGVTTHNYSGIAGNNWNGLTADNFAKSRFQMGNFDYFALLKNYMEFEGKADLYLTEWGNLDSLIYWGARESSDRYRYQFQKYPFAAVPLMERMLYMIKSEAVEMMSYHTLRDDTGFGLVETAGLETFIGPDGEEYKTPMMEAFIKMSDLLEECNTSYDLTSEKQPYIDEYRPMWNGYTDETLQLPYVSAFGFGDENKITQAVFVNHTESPQIVSLQGATLKPNWSYGGPTDETIPGWVRNEAYNGATSRHYVDMLDGEDKNKHFVHPNTHEGEVASQTITIEPYTILVADVEGDVVTGQNYSAVKVSRIAEYVYQNKVLLKIGSSIAYVDNVKTSIDESPDVVPFTENGRTLLPLRFVAEKFGFDVQYDDATQGITMTKGDTVVKLTVGQRAYTVNGESFEFDTEAKLIDGRTLVPLRALVEAIGQEIYWDDRGLIMVGKESCSVTDDIDYYFDEMLKLY